MKTSDWILALCVAATGCAGDDGDGDDSAAMDTGNADESGDDDDDDASESGDASGVDMDAVMAQAEDYQSLTLISAEAVASQHALGDTVNVWVSGDQADAYKMIDPEAGGSDVTFPEGTYLIKEHFVGEGDFNGLTLMYKAAEGYDAETGDWWWARLNADFSFAETGKVGFCIDCHAGASASGYVFGVPVDNQQ